MKNLFYLFAIIVSATLYTSCKNKCHDSDCQNGGACYQGVCWCPEGYTGGFCEIKKQPEGGELQLRGNYKGTITVLQNNYKTENVIVEASDMYYPDASWDGMMTFIIKDDSTTTYRCKIGVNNSINNDTLAGGFYKDTLSFAIYTSTNKPYYTFKGVKQ